MERRGQKRQRARYDLNVCDNVTGQPVGKVVDLSIFGLQLLSDEPIGINTNFQLRMSLPSFTESSGLNPEVDVFEQIDFEARSVWSQKYENDEFFLTGFKIMNPSAENTEAIELAFQDAIFGS